MDCRPQTKRMFFAAERQSLMLLALVNLLEWTLEAGHLEDVAATHTLYAMLHDGDDAALAVVLSRFELEEQRSLEDASYISAMVSQMHATFAYWCPRVTPYSKLKEVHVGDFDFSDFRDKFRFKPGHTTYPRRTWVGRSYQARADRPYLFS